MFQAKVKSKNNSNSSVIYSLEKNLKVNSKAIEFLDNRSTLLVPRILKENNDHAHFNKKRVSLTGGMTQFKVQKYAAGRWYSTFDPYRTFWTKSEATKYDKELRLKGRIHLSSRVPTLYTYTHTKPNNKISSIPQGPHTVAHRVTLSALTSITTMPEVQYIFDEQVVNANEVRDFLNKDELPLSGAFSNQIQARINRFINDYEAIHDSLMMELNKTPGDLVTAKHLLNQLLNMDPYAVYSWKTTTAASKASLKGKSESIQNPTFSYMYDKPPASSFRNQANLNEFVNHREQLFDDYMAD